MYVYLYDVLKPHEEGWKGGMQRTPNDSAKTCARGVYSHAQHALLPFL